MHEMVCLWHYSFEYIFASSFVLTLAAATNLTLTTCLTSRSFGELYEYL